VNWESDNGLGSITAFVKQAEIITLSKEALRHLMKDIFGYTSSTSFISPQLTPLPSSGLNHCVIYIDSDGFVNFRKDEKVIREKLEEQTLSILEVATPLPSKADVDEIYLFFDSTKKIKED
jgi:hypothetical protein